MPDAVPRHAFRPGALGALAGGHGFTLWLYRGGALPLAALEAPGFFAAARGLLRPGDGMLLLPADGPPALRFVGEGNAGPRLVTGR